MCLLVLAWNHHPRYRVVLAANRDEFHARPAAAMHWWAAPEILSGRDLEAGGAWLAVGRDGRFGVVTNYRDLQGPRKGAPSRGGLIPDFLGATHSARDFAERLAPQAGQYSGFNLLAGDATHLLYAANRAPQPTRELGPGIHGLSNHLLDTPWPKLARTRTRFEALLRSATLGSEALFAMLTDREPTADDGTRTNEDDDEPRFSRELERALSAPFIVNERYGTRSSTLLFIGYDGAVSAKEQRYDASGRLIGRDDFEFQI
jgi:uncharacterized protein with NRDE domain